MAVANTLAYQDNATITDVKGFVVQAKVRWNSTLFAFSLITEGTTEKVLQLKMPLQSIYNQALGFIEQNIYF